MMISKDEKVFISVRLRPLIDEEIRNNDVSDWECINDNTIVCKNTNILASETSVYPNSYSFGRVFSADYSTREVYEQGVKEIALSVLKGINSIIFFYGKKRSGKTYTMKGITEYVVADIYEYMHKHPERQFVVKLTAMEISCGSANDLLSSEKGKIVEESTTEILKDINHATQLLSSLIEQRRSRETHEMRSLSHHIVKLTIESSPLDHCSQDNNICSLTASLNLVDLAVSRKKSTSNKVEDCCQINHITSEPAPYLLSKESGSHIPFGDCMLTPILHGGNDRTAVICTMSPARSHIESSRDTLVFALSVMKTVTNAQVNVMISDKALVKYLQEKVARLETELSNKDTHIEQLEKEIKSLILQRDIAQSQVKEYLNMFEGDVRSSSMQIESENYPQIRVHLSPDSEIQDIEALMSRSSSRDHFAKVLYTEGILDINGGPRALISSPHSSDIEYAYSSGEELSYDGVTESSFSNLEEFPKLHGNLDTASTFSASVKKLGTIKSELKDEDKVKESVVSVSGPGSISPASKDYSSLQYLDVASAGNQHSKHYLDDIYSNLSRCRSCKESVITESASPRPETSPCEDISSIKSPLKITDDCEIESVNVKVSNDQDQRVNPTTLEEDASAKGAVHATKNVKGAHFDPIGDELRRLTSWPVQFKKLQREILHLWDICNISLAHRTYFFLLFRGETADAMYMEMEIRRIKFLKDKFSRGEKATVNLRCLTHSSSATALRQERRMLSDQMLKKYSEKERESLFVEWGIDLHAKMRRLKLARRIWSENDNIEHVTRSAYLVAKLLGFIEPGHVPSNDISNLQFAPKSHMGICSFKSSLMSIL